MQMLIQKVRDWWETADRTQRVVSIFGSAFLILLLGGTLFFASRPKLEPIFPGAMPAEQGTVRDAVVGYGFPVEVNSRGEVMVPADKMAEIKMRLSQDGKAPIANGGDPTAGTSGMFMTPVEIDAQMKKKKETELAKSIMTLKGVQNANVHINFGKDSPFGDEKVAPSAVVNLTEKAGLTLSADEAKAIARLVQNSVSGLKAEKVSVINNEGEIIFDGDELSQGDARATRKLQAEADESRRREKELQKTLDEAFGVGTTVAKVSLELNMDEVEKNEETNTPSENPIEQSKAIESYGGRPGGPIQGGTGADVNMSAGAPATPDSGNNSTPYKGDQSQTKYLANKTVTKTTKAAGELMSMSVNVLADKAKIKDIPSVQAFIDSLIKTKQNPSFSAVVTATEFSNAAAENQKKAQTDSQNAERIQQVVSLLPILALLVVGFMLVKAIGKTGKQETRVVALANGGTMSLPGQDNTLSLPQGNGGGSSNVLGVDYDEPQYDLSQLDDIGPMNFGMGGGAAGAQGMALTHGGAHGHGHNQYEEEEDEEVIIRDIKEKVDVPLEQIRKLAKERPETVAMLLKTWMMEDR